MEQIGRWLVFAGFALVVAGGVVWGLGALFPNFRLGRLPGDLVIKQSGFSLYVPITTMLLASLLLTGILWVVSWWMRR